MIFDICPTCNKSFLCLKKLIFALNIVKIIIAFIITGIIIGLIILFVNIYKKEPFTTIETFQIIKIYLILFGLSISIIGLFGSIGIILHNYMHNNIKNLPEIKY